MCVLLVALKLCHERGRGVPVLIRGSCWRNQSSEDSGGGRWLVVERENILIVKFQFYRNNELNNFILKTKVGVWFQCNIINNMSLSRCSLKPCLPNIYFPSSFFCVRCHMNLWIFWFYISTNLGVAVLPLQAMNPVASKPLAIDTMYWRFSL